jgi:glutaconate CoA-transferase subunit B
MLECMALLQQGRVSLGFLGAAEVDRHGNLNSTEVRGPSGNLIRLPGSGGACDIATLAHRFVVLLDHQKERLPQRVNYITSPGNGPWRENRRLQQGGPAAAITTKAVLRFGDSGGDSESDTGEAVLESYHPGVSVKDIVANTGWPLKVPARPRQTRAPNARELRVIRAYDPQRFWTK